MKLAQLQEARYSGLHPLVEWVKDIVMNEKRITSETNFMAFSERDLPVIIRDMDKVFGQQQHNNDQGYVAPFWYHQTLNWTYIMSVGRDDEDEYKDAPYGMNVGREARIYQSS